MNQVLLGFLSGICVTLVGAYITSLLQRIEEGRRQRKKTLSDVYFKLLDLYNKYFWITCFETHRRPQIDKDLKDGIRGLAWQISDLLRVEDVPYTQDILKALMSEEFSSAKERYDFMRQILEQIGRQTNPTFQREFREISKDNIKKIETCDNLFKFDTNTPGMLW